MKKGGLFAILIFLALALGCTQEGGDETTVQIQSTAALDGFAVPGSASPGSIITVGDSSVDSQAKGFVSFDLSAIGSTIKSARLRMYQAYTQGSPYADLGTIVVDHVYVGVILDPLDFDGGTITNNIGTLSSAATEEWKELDVTEAVQQDYAEERDNSQFRLHFLQGSDSDGVIDAAFFEDGENNAGTANQPALVVTYE